MSPQISVLPLRTQNAIIHQILQQRFETILPTAMRNAGIDMWVILCQEDDHDPIFRTMLPMNCWTPILQILVFFDHGLEKGVERINLSMTDMHDLYVSPWKGHDHHEQWEMLAEIIKQRAPEKIGLNIGKTQWAAGGLTYNLYQQFMAAMDPSERGKIVDAEKICTHWGMTFSQIEKDFYPDVITIAHQIIAKCYSREVITPGTTTTDDLEWAYWQLVNDLGLEVSFKPFFRIIRSDTSQISNPTGDKVIRPGDLLHCDVGIKYLRLCSDHQEIAYVLRAGEQDAPAGIKHLLAQNNRLQQVFLEGFARGLTGNQMLKNMLQKAHEKGIPGPKIYSHSLGYFLHQPGPLIGLPWEQESNPGRGDVALDYDTCFTMELSIEDKVPEWDDQNVRMSTEQVVMFTREGCQAVDGVQTELHLI